MNDQGESLVAAPAHRVHPETPSGTDPFTRSAPALPAIVGPDSTYTTMPGTNDQLVHHGALRSAVRPALFWLAILLPVYVTPLYLVGVPAPVIPLVGVALLAWLYLSTYRKLRRMLRSVIDNAMPAPSDPPPQPPLPALLDPHTSVIAEPDLAVRLAVTQRREPWRARGALISVLGLAVITAEFAFLGGLLFGPLGVTFPLVFGTLALACCWRMANRPPAAIVRHHERAAYPGAVLSAQFGTDAMLLATPAWVMRMPYSMIGKITFRSGIAVLAYGLVPIVLPSALFPPPITAGLRELGLTIVER